MVLMSVPHPPVHAVYQLGVNTTIFPVPFVNIMTAASTSPKRTPGTSVMIMIDARNINSLKSYLPTTSEMARANFPSAASQLAGRVVARLLCSREWMSRPP